MLEWSLAALRAVCERVVVAVPAGYEDPPDRVRGGDSRSASVRNALAAAPEATMAVVHDAARPLVTRDLVERCLRGLEGCEGAIAAARMTDTVKEDGRAAGWCARSTAPGSGRCRRRRCSAPTSCGARSTRGEERLAAATDDASLVEDAGGSVRLVEAPPENMKVTTPARPAGRRGDPPVAMLTDYHVHLRPDEDGTTPERYFTAANAERYREAAGERGIEELGVAEHIHRFTQSLDVWTHPWYRHWARDDLDAYCDFVREETDLRLGIEADFLPGREDRLANLLDGRPWDYVVGSLHFLRDEAVDLHAYPDWGEPGTSGARRTPRRSGSGTSRRSARRRAAASSTSWPTPTS